MPEELAQKMGMTYNVTFCFGYLLAFGLGGILPDAEDFEANKGDELWRVIYLMPAFIGITELLLIMLVFKEEPIAYCLMMGDDEQAKKHMYRVYRKADPDSPETLDELIEL